MVVFGSPAEVIHGGSGEGWVASEEHSFCAASYCVRGVGATQEQRPPLW